MRDAHSLRLPLIAAALSLWLAHSASAVTMDWKFVGDPGNACEVQPPRYCFGAVGDTYNIGTYEVTNAQYAEFLNAKAAADPLQLYSPLMGNPGCGPNIFNCGGITRTGSSGSYTYSAIEGRENWPVNHVSFWDAARFANWLNNGQGSGDTETGAYTLLGGTPIPSNGQTVERNLGAEIFLPNEDEWYKAAYYHPSSASYFDYPAGSDAQTACVAPTATPNSANCLQSQTEQPRSPAPVGSYTGSASPYGTFDQGGNIYEWTDTINRTDASSRQVRGGSFMTIYFVVGAAVRQAFGASSSGGSLGFRVAMIPVGLPDADGDHIPDVLDKCMLDSRNVGSSCDTDQDGYGNPCDPDFDQNFSVSAVDFGTFFIPSFQSGAPSTLGEDMDCNGSVNSNDFSGYFVPKFKGALGGTVPGPSGLPCAGTPGCM